jgi:hypothetical protein
MDMKIVNIWERTSTDGYHDSRTGEYFPTSTHAGLKPEGGWNSTPKKHSAIEVSERKLLGL